MSRLEVPEGTHVHAADAAAHSLGANAVTSIFEDEYRDEIDVDQSGDNDYVSDQLVSRKLVAVETDVDIKQADFDRALGEHSEKVAARQGFLEGIEKITGVKVPVNVNAVEVFVSAILEILLLSDDETKAKLAEHVKSFQRAKQA